MEDGDHNDSSDFTHACSERIDLFCVITFSKIRLTQSKIFDQHFSYPGLLLAQIIYTSHHAPPRILYTFRRFTI